jgi:hypothetical protein
MHPVFWREDRETLFYRLVGVIDNLYKMRNLFSHNRSLPALDLHGYTREQALVKPMKVTHTFAISVHIICGGILCFRNCSKWIKSRGPGASIRKVIRGGVDEGFGKLNVNWFYCSECQFSCKIRVPSLGVIKSSLGGVGEAKVLGNLCRWSRSWAPPRVGYYERQLPHCLEIILAIVFSTV